MIRARLRMVLVCLLSVCLIAVSFLATKVHAGKNDIMNRTGQGNWNNVNYGTTPLGGAWTWGQFAHNAGYGGQGFNNQYTDYSTGNHVGYSSMGYGMGMGGFFAGDGGATSSHSSFAYGSEYQPTSTFGWSRESAMSGSIFSNNTNYFAAQPLTMFGFMGGLFGGFGGFAGFGGYSPVFSPTNGYGLGGWATKYGWW